jgi:ubiquinone biosynthesis accessory factor UbiK
MHRLGAESTTHGANDMKPTDLFSDFQNRVSEALRNSPAADIEKNVRAMMTQGFAKLDLVTREEFDVQSQVLARTRARLEELETRVAALEAQLKSATPANQ